MTWAWISAAPSKIERMRASQRTREMGYSRAKPLPPWICRALSAHRPGDAGGEELGHAGLEVAAAARVLLAGGEVGELAGDHDLDRHHRELGIDAGEGDQRLAELVAVPGVAQGELQRALRHADGAGGGLDAGGLEGAHELLEALALDAAEKVRGRDAEAVEGELVLLHAAVAEDLDLAAGHAGGGEGVGLGAARLRGEQHGEAGVVGGGGVGADEHGHQVGAGGVGDPGLVAGDERSPRRRGWRGCAGSRGRSRCRAR